MLWKKDLRSKIQILLLAVLLVSGLAFVFASPSENFYDQYDNVDARKIHFDLTKNMENPVIAKWDENAYTWIIEPQEDPDLKKAILDSNKFGKFLNQYIRIESMKEKLKNESREITLKFSGKIFFEPDIYQLFSELEYVKLEGLDNLDSSEVENMKGLFEYSKLQTGFTLPNWDTSNVTTMDRMFYGASIEGSNLNFKNWDMSSLHHINRYAYNGMDGIFSHAKIKNTNISFKDVEFPKIKICRSIFENADIISDIQNTIDMGMTFSCEPLSEREIRGFDEPYKDWVDNFELSEFFKGANVKNYYIDFRGMKMPKFGKLHSFFTTGETQEGEEKNCVLSDSIVDMDDLSFPNTYFIMNMFANTKVEGNSELRLKNWDMPQIKEITGLFAGMDWKECSKLDISGWKFPDTPNRKGQENRLHELFNESNLPQADLDLSKWNTTFADKIHSNFRNATLGALNVANWNVENATTLHENFWGLNLQDPKKYDFENSNVSTWNPKSLTMANMMFYNNKQVKQINLSKWELPENFGFEHFIAAFMGTENLEEFTFRGLKSENAGIEYILNDFSTKKYWVAELNSDGSEKEAVSGPYIRKQIERPELFPPFISGPFHTFKNSDKQKFEFKEGSVYKLHLRKEEVIPEPIPEPTPLPKPAPKPEVKPEVKPESKQEDPKPSPEPSPEPTPEVQSIPEVQPQPELETEEILGLLSSAGAGGGRDTAVLPGMIPMKSVGAATQGQDTAVDPGFIAAQASMPTATQVAGANLPKTGEGMNTSTYAVLLAIVGFGLVFGGLYIKRIKR